ncbi:MAG: hypothetical protein ACM3PE_10375 [Deltaproteobacteria bacterium]
MGKLVIFAGGLGSGKTEIALSFARTEARKGEQSILADVDLINPFFSSRLVVEELEREGVRLLAPRRDLAFGDVPQLPPEIISSIRQDNNLFIDLGGDESGVLVMGYLRSYILDRPYEFMLVVNPYRPFAGSLDDLFELKNMLEISSRVAFTGIISNPNLVEETTSDVVREGHRKFLQWAKKIGLEVRYRTVEERLFQELQPEYSDIIHKLSLHFRPSWLGIS